MSELEIPVEIYRRQRLPVMLIITGPSGAGKDAVIRRMREMGHDFYFVVTTTSRACRVGEVHGVDYYFVSTEHFRALSAGGQLLEQADVYYQDKGITREEIQRGLASGKDLVVRVDVQGAATLRRLIRGVVTVFLVPESGAELERRLRERRTETEEQFHLRLQRARDEIELATQFNYVVVNPCCGLDQAVRRIEAILEAEKSCSLRDEVAL